MKKEKKNMQRWLVALFMFFSADGFCHQLLHDFIS